jgi:hypothetical protein
MSGLRRATRSANRRRHRAAALTSVALASGALWCACLAADVAGATGAATSGPSAGPSVGSPGSQAALEALARARILGTNPGKVRGVQTTPGLPLGAATGTARPNAARPGISRAAPARPGISPAAPPPARVYTGPIRPSQLGSAALGGSALGRIGVPAKRPSPKSGISTAAIVVAALGALLVLAAAAWALARRRAYEPHWWLSLQHSLGEAGYRTSSTWAEFSDWARRGG